MLPEKRRTAPFTPVVPSKEIVSHRNAETERVDVAQKAEVFETTYRHYLEQIADVDLVSRAERLGADVMDNGLVIPFYGEPHRISPKGVFNAREQKAPFAVSVLLCCYILQCPKTEPVIGDWVTYREFKDASPLVGYFTSNTHKIIETSFSGQIEKLKTACRRMGGRWVEAPAFDVAVLFEMLPRVPIFLRFNDKEDLFPAQSSILFRQSAGEYMDMECLAIGGTYLTGMLIGDKPEVTSV